MRGEGGFSPIELLIVMGIFGTIALTSIAGGYVLHKRVIDPRRPVGGVTLEEVLGTPAPAPTEAPTPTPAPRVVERTEIIEVPATQPPTIIVVEPTPNYHPEPTPYDECDPDHPEWGGCDGYEEPAPHSESAPHDEF
jgi:hypothetical protein